MVRISLERFLCANVYASGKVTTVCGATTVKSTFLSWSKVDASEQGAVTTATRGQQNNNSFILIETALVTGNLSHSPNTVVYQLRPKSWQFL
jgi:hypothetical protein